MRAALANIFWACTKVLILVIGLLFTYIASRIFKFGQWLNDVGNAIDVALPETKLQEQKPELELSIDGRYAQMTEQQYEKYVEQANRVAFISPSEEAFENWLSNHKDNKFPKNTMFFVISNKADLDEYNIEFHDVMILPGYNPNLDLIIDVNQKVKKK